jgi:phosphotransferase system, enzyme I, PtsP
MLKRLLRIVQEINAAHNFAEALQILVTQVRDAAATEACTVFLIDKERQEYVLMATDGLKPELVGRIRLALHEGLIGFVGDRKEPLNLEDASSHPQYRFFAEAGEEAFKAFLGVPIIHHRKVLGVLIIQQKEKRRFDDSEEAFLETISAQLSGIIAHAESTGAVGEFLEFLEFKTKKTRKKEIVFCGIPGSSGIGMGTAMFIYPPADLEAVPERMVEDINYEIGLFKKALESCRLDIEILSKRLAQTLPPEEQELFDVYLHLLNSSSLVDEVIKQIEMGQWAQGALSNVVKKHVQRFEEMEDEYLKERASDFHDLGRRILAHLQNSQIQTKHFKENTVLIGEEITAANLAEVPEGCLVGIVSSKGSNNSHVAILARALGIPAVMGVDGIANVQFENQFLILDGYQGQVYINPPSNILKEFTDLAEERRKFDKHLEQSRNLPSQTADGHRVSLFVNTGLAIDADLSLSVGAEGVGLYRTEIPFMTRDSFPVEEEQRLIYRQLLQAFSPRVVVMRTLDIGGDKALSYFPIKEENPFLGWRGIRITLDHPELFLVQIRAMLRASSGLNNLWIMLPMISGVNEVDDALLLIKQAYKEVQEEDNKIAWPLIGVMIEVPSAVYQTKALAKRVDFLSVGTNDLIQYLLAVDRNNARVANLYDGFHPAVLEALYAIVQAGHAENKTVSICGEMAGDPLAVILLLAMGFDALSMSSSALTKIKWVIRHFTLVHAREILDVVMAMDNPSEIRKYLEKSLEAVGLGNLIHARHL